MQGVDVSHVVKTVTKTNLEGNIKATATTKEVCLTLYVKTIGPGKASIVLRLPWGQIYGLAKTVEKKQGGK
ncbi:unnamed protein product [marine sediment metagenome]|uniref:Uncharacterized protein n=1 Tax=marine sediment metagenome TaxID=412755 RepID=X1DA32_9ZZZZ